MYVIKQQYNSLNGLYFYPSQSRVYLFIYILIFTLAININILFQLLVSHHLKMMLL